MLVALTGGIAAGKSTVARMLESLGAVIVDADQLARDAVAPGTSGLRAIVAQWGEKMLREDGTLDRAALGAVVFHDEAARLRLESIVHPEVQRLSQEAFARAVAQSPDGVVVYDVPLLTESGRGDEFDAVIVVEASDEVRLARLMALRGMDEAEARGRISAQATNAERRALATYLIDSSGSLADTERQTRNVWLMLTARGE